MYDLNLKQALDAEQYTAVMSPAKRLLVLANAGSGKTRVLTYRAANFIREGFPERTILMLTFTKKAANEMKERISKLIGNPRPSLTAGTFHGVACRLIRRFPEYANLPSTFTILDTDDGAMIAGTVLKNLIEQDETLKKTSGLPAAKHILNNYSLARNLGMPYKQLFKGIYDPDDTDKGRTCLSVALSVIRGYEQFKQDTPALDFDDLLLRFSAMLDNPQFKAMMHILYPALFVDEYQDINPVQHNIICKLAGDDTYLTAVGDDAQCIYGFRGSEVGYITRFSDEFGNCPIIRIPSNYRSSGEIVDTALQVLNRSGYWNGMPKNMLSARGKSGTPVNTFRFRNEYAQADYIALECKKASRRMAWSDIAILVRGRRDGISIEKALLKARIPVSMECGIAFYAKQQIRIAIRFLKFLYMPGDKTALAGFLDTCPGVGAKTRDSLFEKLSENQFNLSVFQELKTRGKDTTLLDGLKSAVQSAWIMKQDGCTQPDMLAMPFIIRYLRPWCGAKYTEGLTSRLSELDTFLEQLAEYETLEEFLDDAALNTGETVDDDNGRVRIMTIHRAKGLEFKKVFLASISDGIMPCPKQENNPEELEEELRVLYVAITRAMSELDILSVKKSSRVTDTDGQPRTLPPSRFLSHIKFREIP